MDEGLTTLWGFIAFFGFIISLQLPYTEAAQVRFRTDPSTTALNEARRWTRTAYVTSLVMVLVVTVAAIGIAADQRWEFQPPGELKFWLLCIAVLAPCLFVGFVYSLIGAPPNLRIIVVPKGVGERDSPGGYSEEVVTRVYNRTNEDLFVIWLDWVGNASVDHEYRVPANTDVKVATRLGHRWLVRDSHENELGAFQAEPTAQVQLTDSLLAQ